jgi:hypothetical protein
MFGHTRHLRCSFCGRHAAEVAKLAAGPQKLLRRRVHICDACVAAATRIMANAGDAKASAVREREPGRLAGLLTWWSRSKGPTSTSLCGPAPHAVATAG